MTTLAELTLIRAPIECCFDLARSVEVHLVGNTHSGEAAVANASVASGLIDPGQRVTWRAKHFGVWFQLTSEITAARELISLAPELWLERVRLDLRCTALLLV